MKEMTLLKMCLTLSNNPKCKKKQNVNTDLKIEIENVDACDEGNRKNVNTNENNHNQVKTNCVKNMSTNNDNTTFIKREVKTETEMENLMVITHNKHTDLYEPKIIEIKSLVGDEYFKQEEEQIDQNKQIEEKHCVNASYGDDSSITEENGLNNSHEIEVKNEQFDDIYYDSVDLDANYIEVKTEDENSNEIENAVTENTIKIEHPDNEKYRTESSIKNTMLKNSGHKHIMKYADEYVLKENEYYDDTKNILIVKVESIDDQVFVQNFLSEEPKNSEQNFTQIIDSDQNNLEESESLIIKIESIDDANCEYDEHSRNDNSKISPYIPSHNVGAEVEINEEFEVEPEGFQSSSSENTIGFAHNEQTAIMVETIKDDNLQFDYNATNNNKIKHFQSDSGVILDTVISRTDTQSDDQVTSKITCDKNFDTVNISKTKNTNHTDITTIYQSSVHTQNTNTRENKLEALIKKFNIDQEDFDDQDNNNEELKNRKVMSIDNRLNTDVILELNTTEYEIKSEQYNKLTGHTTGPEKNINVVSIHGIQTCTSIKQLEELQNEKIRVEVTGKINLSREQNFESEFVKPSRPNTPQIIGIARCSTPGTPAVENEMSLKSLLDLYTDDINRLDDNSKPLIWPPPSLEDSQLDFPELPTEKLHCEDCKGKFTSEYDIATHSCKKKITDFTEFNKSIKKRKTLDPGVDDPEIEDENLKPDKIEVTQKYIRRGVDIGPYKCPICNKSIARRSGLKIHIKRHQNTASYTCEYCPKSFVTLYDLDRHIFTHTKKKGFRLMCEICRRPFVSRDGLNQHKIIAHSGYAAYQCDICNRSYSQEYRLWRHKKTQHDFGSEVKQANVIEQSLELLDDLEKPPHERNLKLVNDKISNDESRDISAKTTVLVKNALIRKSQESKSVQVSRIQSTPNIKIEDIEPMDIDLSDLETLSLDMADIIEGNVEITEPKPVSLERDDIKLRNADVKLKYLDTFKNKKYMIGCKTSINVQDTLKIASETLPSPEIEIDDIRRELGIEIVDSLPAKEEIIPSNLHNESQPLNNFDNANVTTALDDKKSDLESAFTEICELRREFGIDTIDTCTENYTIINLNSRNDDLGIMESEECDTTDLGLKTIDLEIEDTSLSFLDEALGESHKKENNDFVVKEITKAKMQSLPPTTSSLCPTSDNNLLLNDMLTFKKPSISDRPEENEACQNSSECLIRELFDLTGVEGLKGK